MVFQVIEEQRDSARILKTFGTRQLAANFIARARKPLRNRLSIREHSVPDHSPALHYPYLPGRGQ